MTIKELAFNLGHVPFKRGNYSTINLDSSNIVLIHQLMNHALIEYGCMMRCEHLTLTNVGSRKTDCMGILNEGPLECLRETLPYIGTIQVTRDRAIGLSRNSTCSSWSIICLFCCLLVSVKTSILTSKLFLRVPRIICLINNIVVDVVLLFWGSLKRSSRGLL